MSTQAQQKHNNNNNNNDNTPDWGYFPEQLTPDQWASQFQVGKQQSPINILIGNTCRFCSSTTARGTTTTTCCRGTILKNTSSSNNNNNNNNNNNKDDRSLADRFREKASLTGQRHRSHLDSVGEEGNNGHERSSSISSSGSSGSSSSSSNGLNERSNSDSGADEDSDESLCNRCLETKDARKSRSNRLSSSVSAQCKHKQQIQQQQNTRQVVSLRKLFLGYPRFMNTIQLCNTGHNWQVSLPNELAKHTLLSGPPLGDREYRLAQFHCHWGEDCDHGSEHQINGKSYAAEIHFVHWNCTDFASPEEASKHRHGLAVLAVLVQALEGEQNRNKHLDKIIAGLKRIHKPGSSVNVHARLDLKKLFPANRWNYATYEGSLTTPPLSEVVDWLVFLDPIQCSTSQIEHFRQIRCPVSGQQQRLTNNCRPVQPTGDRLVTIWSHH